MLLVIVIVCLQCSSAYNAQSTLENAGKRIPSYAYGFYRPQILMKLGVEVARKGSKMLAYERHSQNTINLTKIQAQIDKGFIAKSSINKEKKCLKKKEKNW